MLAGIRTYDNATHRSANSRRSLVAAVGIEAEIDDPRRGAARLARPVAASRRALRGFSRGMRQKGGRSPAPSSMIRKLLILDDRDGLDAAVEPVKDLLPTGRAGATVI